jgi:hypothetical protein
MDSKRKVNGGGVPAGEDLDDRAAKRRKLPSVSYHYLHHLAGASEFVMGIMIWRSLAARDLHAPNDDNLGSFICKT